MKLSLNQAVSKAGAGHILICAALLLTSIHRAGAEDCYRPKELRADAEAKLAAFLLQAAVVCSDAARVPTFAAWEAFRKVPDIAVGLARADEVRAGYYERLYSDDDWERRWRSTELAVTSYASHAMRNSPPGYAGCTRLMRQLIAFKDGGWRTYSSAVDRFFAKMRPQVRLCEE